MFCSNCGAKNNDGAKFCTACGAMLNQPAKQVTEHPQESGTADVKSQIQNMQYQKESVQQKPYQKAIIELGISIVVTACIMTGCIIGILL